VVDERQRRENEVAVVLEDAEAWAAELEVLREYIGRHFRQPEVRRRARPSVRGLLSPIERNNGWQVAEQVGDATPDGIRRLLAAAHWDADAVRDELRE
jgi:hypothetical protein